MSTSRSPLLACALLLAACGPRGDKHSGTATPAPAASPAATSGLVAAPSAPPNATTTVEPTPSPADPAPAAAGETVIHYRWSGGFSMYQYYAATIRGKDTAKIVFVVKPGRDSEKRVEDTLDAAQFAELKSLFDKVNFDKVGETARGVRIMDIGQVAISREGGGHERHEVIENGQTKADADITALRQWFDPHIRQWLEKSGVGLKKAAPAASATPAAH